MANQGRGPGQRTDPGRRPTKSERKEQARAEREQIQRQMSARRRNRRLGIALFAAAAAIVVVVVFVLQPGSSPLPSTGDLLASASAQASTAGCDSVQSTPNYQDAADDAPIDSAHIGNSDAPTAPPLTSYATSPPASGPHDPTPLSAGMYSSPPDVYSAIHALEHAGTIIWYAPSAADSDAVRQIKDFYSQSDNIGQAKVIVAPYDYPSQGEAGVLPNGIQMALVAWHRLQTCAQANLAAAYSFTSQYNNATPGGQYIGVAREPNGAM